MNTPVDERAVSATDRPTVGDRAPDPHDPHRVRSPRDGRWLTAVVAFAVFALVATAYLVTLALHPPIATGDEPHYLIIAESIVHDDDVDLANNYADPAEVQAVYPDSGPLLPIGHAGVYRPGGPEVPVHALGLPVLAAALMKLGFHTFGIRTALALTAAAIAPMLVLLLHRLIPGHRVAGAVAATVTCLVAPLFLFSDLVYPDLPGAFLLTLAATCLVLGGRRPWALGLAGLALACVPWFHIRMSLLVAPLAVALLVRAWGRRRAADDASGDASDDASDDPSGDPARVTSSTRSRVVALAAVVVPLAVSGVGLLALNHALYGSFSPSAAYSVAPFDNLAFSPGNVRTWSIGMLFSPGAGVLPLAPVLLLALVGVWLVIARWRWPAVAVCAFVGLYYLVSTGTALGGGYCPPGRWVVAFAPVAAVPLTLVLTRALAARVVAGLLIVVSLATTVSSAAADSLKVAAGTLSGRASVPVVMSTAAFWPALGGEPVPTSLTQRASDVFRTVGRAAGDGTASTSVDDGPGALAFSPGSDLPAGLWTATFVFPDVSAPAGTVLGQAQVVDERGVVGSVDVVVWAGGSGAQTLTVPVSTDGREVQLRVLSNGTGSMRLADLTIAPSAPGSVSNVLGPGRRLLLVLWFGVLIGLLLVVLRSGARGRRADDDEPDPTGAWWWRQTSVTPRRRRRDRHRPDPV